MSWRDTLYVWDGILVAEKEDDADKKIPLKWEGTWVAVEGADARMVEAPKRGAFDEFVESDMRFEVSGAAKEIESEGEGKSPPFKCTLTTGAGWDMGEGDEKKKHHDEEHELLMVNLKWTGDLQDQRNNLVFARGKNAHGSFVSAGWTRPGNRLTLARRYLEDGDVRANWELEELREAVLEEIHNTEGKKLRIPPWKCETLHSHLQTKKRARHDDDEDHEAKKAAKQ